MIDTTFETKEQGIEKLKNAVSLRNQMGGALYWNIINDDCVKIARQLLGIGVEKSEIKAILNGR